MVKPLAVSSLERTPKALANVPLPRSPRKNSSACLPGGAWTIEVERWHQQKGWPYPHVYQASHFI